MAASVDSSGGRKLRSRQWVGSTQAADRNRQNAGLQQEGSKQSGSIGHAAGMQQVGNRQTIRQQAGSRKEGGRQQEDSRQTLRK